MATRSSIQIHVFTNGDVQIDQLFNALDNTNSPGVIYNQEIPAGVSTAIFNPFTLMPAGGPFFNLITVLIKPDVMNTSDWSLSTEIVPPPIRFHKTNPMLLSIVAISSPLYIFHDGPGSVAFQFTWV